MRKFLKWYRSLNDFTKTLLAFIGIIVILTIAVLSLIFAPFILIIIPAGLLILMLWKLAQLIAGTDNDDDLF